MANAVMLAAQNELLSHPKPVGEKLSGPHCDDFFLILSLGYQILIRGGQKMSLKQEVSYVRSFQMPYGLLTIAIKKMENKKFVPFHKL